MTAGRQIAIAWLAIALSAAQPARADDEGARLTRPAARAELERGLAAHAAHDYETAIAAFNAAYAIEPHPDLLFALAQAERLSGDCASAIDFYRRFLATAPPERKAEPARRALSRCERAIAQQPRVEPPPPRPEPSVPVAPAVEPPPRAAPRWYRDVAGGLLVTTGTLTAGAGGFLLWRARSAREDLAGETRYGEFLDRLERADRLRWTGVAVTGAGLALVTAGVVRYVLVAGRPPEREPARISLTAAVESGGIVLGITGPL